MASPTSQVQGQQRTEGLADIAEGNARIMEALGRHAQEMGLEDEVHRKAEECADMCREVSQHFRGSL